MDPSNMEGHIMDSADLIFLGIVAAGFLIFTVTLAYYTSR